MFQKTKGLILREVAYKDNDKLLTVLSAEWGLLTVKARGVRKTRGLGKSACQILTYSEFTLLERQGYHTITEAEPIEMFSALRDDLELLSLGSYFAQTAEVLAQEDFPDPELLTLLLYALHALCVGREKTLVKAAFELRLMGLSGYAPSLEDCPAPRYFCVTDGSFSEDADGGLGLRLPVSPGTVAAMTYILSAPVEKVFSFTLGEASTRELSGLCETYFLTKTERGFSTLDFYKSILLT